MNRKASFQLSVNFLVILIICIVVFGFSIYIIKKFFTHAETMKMIYDERTEREIERLLDDGSRVAIPFDRKTVGNGEFETFGIGILNVLNEGPDNNFDITVRFNKAFDKRNEVICDINDPSKPTSACGVPDTWLQTTASTGVAGSGVFLRKRIKNNDQEKFLLGIGVRGAPSGTYIFDMMVCVNDVDQITNDITKCPVIGFPDPYDTLHKLYVDVP